MRQRRHLVSNLRRFLQGTASNVEDIIVCHVAPREKALDLERCGYEQSAKSAEDANRRREQPTAARSERASRQIENEAEAAESRQARARECEQRLHENADLIAQQQSAIAARNAVQIAERMRWGSYLEIFFLIVTIAVGVAAIIATVQQAEADRIQARKQFEAQQRPSVKVSVKPIQILQWGKDKLVTIVVVATKGGGFGAATHVGFQRPTATLDFGPKEESEMRNAIDLDRNRPMQPGQSIVDSSDSADDIAQVTIPPECYIDEENIGGGQCVVQGWVRYRHDGADKYSMTPYALRVWFIRNLDTGKYDLDSRREPLSIAPD